MSNQLNSRTLIYNSGDILGNTMLTGKVYVKGKSEKYAEFICKCGKISWASLSRLKRGATKSCGCFQKEVVKITMTKHGLASHQLYHIWESMKDRCLNENSPQFKDYGGRGVTICKEWVNNAERFITWCIDNGWSKGLTLERSNNDGNYSEDNCKIDTRYNQSRNRRSNIFISAFGESKCIADWIKDSRCKVCFNSLNSRINKMRMNAEDAITTPPQNQNNIKNRVVKQK